MADNPIVAILIARSNEMSILIKQSTAKTVKLGPFLDDTDGKTAETGLSIAQVDIRLSINGGDIAQTHNAAGATHDEAGYYDVPLDATDTGTLGELKIMVSKSGALPVWQTFVIVPANIYDSIVAGSDVLDVSLIQWLGVAPLTLTAAQLVRVDMIRMANTVQGALNLGSNVSSIYTYAQRLFLALVPNTGTVVDAAATTTSFITDLTSSVNNFYKGAVVFTSGALAGQPGQILSYDGSTKKITLLAAATSAPANGVTFVITTTATSRKLVDFLATLGADNRPTISTDAQDLSGSLDVNAKKLGGATPNNLAAGAAMDLIDALKNKSGASGYDRTTDSLEAIGEDAAAIADLPTNAELATALGTADDATLAAVAAVKADTAAILVDTGTTLDNKIDVIDAIVDAITAKTTALPSDPADESLLEAAITAIGAAIRGADNDTLKTLSDQIDTLPTLGAGDVPTQVTFTDGTNPLVGVIIWLTTDSAGLLEYARYITDSNGRITWHLAAHTTYYAWANDYTFSPQEVIVP